METTRARSRSDRPRTMVYGMEALVSSMTTKSPGLAPVSSSATVTSNTSAIGGDPSMGSEMCAPPGIPTLGDRSTTLQRQTSGGARVAPSPLSANVARRRQKPVNTAPPVHRTTVYARMWGSERYPITREAALAVRALVERAEGGEQPEARR